MFTELGWMYSPSNNSQRHCTQSSLHYRNDDLTTTAATRNTSLMCMSLDISDANPVTSHVSLEDAGLEVFYTVVNHTDKACLTPSVSYYTLLSINWLVDRSQLSIMLNDKEFYGHSLYPTRSNLYCSMENVNSSPTASSKLENEMNDYLNEFAGLNFMKTPSIACVLFRKKSESRLNFMKTRSIAPSPPRSLKKLSL